MNYKLVFTSAKLFMILIASIAILSVICTPALATTYYVSTTGNDSNSGTSTTSAFATITHALSAAVAGDTVYVMGGTYYQYVHFSNSGTSANLIYLEGYPGETAVIDGSKFSISKNTYNLVSIDSINYVYLSNLTIQNFTTRSSVAQVNGIRLTGGCSGVTISNCTINNISNTASTGANAHGFLALGNGTNPIANLTLQNCSITNCQTGTSEACTINGYVDGFTLTGNTIAYDSNIGIDAAGGYSANSNSSLNYARDGTIGANIVHDCTSDIGIYCDGSQNITVERNAVYNCLRGIGVVSETTGYPTANVIVRGNWVFDCSQTGIYFGGYPGYTTGGTTGCSFLNNSLYNNNTSGSSSNDGEISIRTQATNNVVKNNVIYARSDNYDQFVKKVDTSGSGNVIDYNLYFKPSGSLIWTWNGTSYSTLATWQSASGQDANATNGLDPQYESVGSTVNLHIAGTSPAVDTGTSDTNQGAYDYDGQARVYGSAIDKGADEWNGGSTYN